jgi:hypothetical protein
MSFLVTQTLKHTKLIIWTNYELPKILKDSIEADFKPFIDKNYLEFKIVDLKQLCNHTIFVKKYNHCTGEKDSHNPILLSDFIRFLVLANYGGIYTDGDVLYLRDMKPFWQTSFMYRWGFLMDYNTAIMGINKEPDAAVVKFLEAAVDSVGQQSFTRAFYPTVVRSFIDSLFKDKFNNPAFEVYNSALFDPAWLCHDGLMGRLHPKSICSFRDMYDFKIESSEFNFTDFFPGAFTYHLHLGDCGSCLPKPVSFFTHIENYFLNKLKSLQ